MLKIATYFTNWLEYNNNNNNNNNNNTRGNTLLWFDLSGNRLGIDSQPTSYLVSVRTITY